MSEPKPIDEQLADFADALGESPAGTDAAGLAIEGGEQAPQEPPSETALILDSWSLRRGREVLEENERLAQALAPEKPAEPKAKNQGEAAKKAWRTMRANKQAELAAADLFASAFEPEPVLAERCTDEVRHRFIEALLETPEAQALRQSTILDEVSSEIAAGAFAEQYVALVKEEEKVQKERAKRKGKPGKDDAFEDEMRALGAVGKAIQKAQEEVKEEQDARSAFGMGEGMAGGKMDPKKVAELFKRVRNNQTLRRICEMAGRFRRLAQSKQRQKSVHGQDDVAGVTLGGDLGRLLPHELAKLADPDQEWDVLRRLVEGQCLQRDLRGVERVAKGPIVVVLDESGSMHGQKVIAGKALALAMAWVARHQRRWIALVAFSGGREGRLLAMPPGRWNEAALFEWLEGFLGGGTCCDVPLVELPGRYWDNFTAQGLQRGKTDILCITDGIVDVPPGVAANFLSWKASEKARMSTLVIGMESCGTLEKVSDDVWSIPHIDVDQEAVGKVLGV